MNALCALSSNISITTKHTSSNLGSILSFAKDGKLTNQKVAPRSNGTTILIENLFESLPVRRSEFTKSIKKHFQKLVRILYSYAIISIGVKITLVNLTNKGSKQVLISTQASKHMSDNISSIFGSKFLTSLTPIQLTVNNITNDDEKTNENDNNDNNNNNDNNTSSSNFNDFSCSNDDDKSPGLCNMDTEKSTAAISDSDKLSKQVGDDEICNITGYVSKAGVGVGRSDNDRQFTFINGRPVDLSKFIKVVNEAWRRYEMKSKPACILDIRVPPGSFDVNLTPDKREVVLMNESQILDKLRLVIDELYAPSRYTFQLSQGLGGTQQDTLFDYSFTGPTISSTAAKVDEDDDVYDSSSSSAQENQGTSDEIDVSDSKGAYLLTESSDTSVKQRQTGIIWMTDVEKETKIDTNSTIVNDLTDIDSIVSNVDKENISQWNYKSSNNPLYDSRKGAHVDTEIVIIDKVEENDNSVDSPKLKRTSSEANAIKSPEIIVLDDEIEQEEDINLTKRLKTDRLSENKEEWIDEPSMIWKLDPSDTLTSFRKAFCRDTIDDNMLIDENVENERTSLLKSCSLDTNPGHGTDSAEAALARVLKKDDFVDMRIIGQFNLGFIIAELNGDLYLLDQHACDEKYRFEKLQQNTTIHQQPLIVPLPLEGSAAEEIVIIDNLKTFEENGFKFLIDENGTCGSRIKLTALPFSKSVQFGIQDVHELASLLNDYSNGDDSPHVSTVLLKNTDSKSKITKLPKLLSMFASRACRSAVMIGTALQKNEMKTIVEKMSTLDQPWNCPHGRPTLRHLAQLPILSSERNE